MVLTEERPFSGILVLPGAEFFFYVPFVPLAPLSVFTFVGVNGGWLS